MAAPSAAAAAVNVSALVGDLPRASPPAPAADFDGGSSYEMNSSDEEKGEACEKCGAYIDDDAYEWASKCADCRVFGCHRCLFTVKTNVKKDAQGAIRSYSSEEVSCKRCLRILCRACLVVALRGKRRCTTKGCWSSMGREDCAVLCAHCAVPCSACGECCCRKCGPAHGGACRGVSSLERSAQAAEHASAKAAARLSRARTASAAADAAAVAARTELAACEELSSALAAAAQLARQAATSAAGGAAAAGGGAAEGGSAAAGGAGAAGP